MLAIFSPELLGKPKINHEDGVRFGIFACQEIVGFYIPMYKSLWMHILDPL